ncbi:MAG: TIR domain-containing protein [Pseudomonadota bacterium]
MTTRTKKSVFISYAEDASEVAHSLVDLISAIGIDEPRVYAFTAPRAATHPGETYRRDVIRSLEQAELVISVLTREYFQSGNCLMELGRAELNSERNHVSIVLGHPGDFPTLLDNTAVRLHFSTEPRTGRKAVDDMRALIERLKALSDRHPMSDDLLRIKSQSFLSRVMEWADAPPPMQRDVTDAQWLQDIADAKDAVFVGINHSQLAK